MDGIGRRSVGAGRGRPAGTAGAPARRHRGRRHRVRAGAAELNEELSRERAEAVASFLVEAGIDPDLVEVGWHGERAPPVRTADGVSEPLNRCVGIVPVPANADRR